MIWMNYQVGILPESNEPFPQLKQYILKWEHSNTSSLLRLLLISESQTVLGIVGKTPTLHFYWLTSTTLLPRILERC